jgi:hypothetical protein
MLPQQPMKGNIIPRSHPRSQMNKLHRPHRESGYIARFDSQQTTDSDGQPDWILHYQPGPKALAEYRTFTKRGGPTLLETEPLEPQTVAAAESSELERELIQRGVTAAVARELVQEHGEAKIRLQIEYVEWLIDKKPEKIDDPSAYLVGAIKNDYAAPKNFISKVEQARRKEARQARERDAAEARRREKEQQEREQAERKVIAAYGAALTQEQQAEHDTAAIAQANAEELKLIEPGPLQRVGMGLLRDGYTRKLLQAQGKLPLPEA